MPYSKSAPPPKTPSKRGKRPAKPSGNTKLARHKDKTNIIPRDKKNQPPRRPGKPAHQRNDANDSFLAVLASGTQLRALNRQLASIPFVLSKTEQASHYQNGQVLRVKAERRPPQGPTPCNVVDVIAPDTSGQESMIALENYNIPTTFPAEVMAETDALAPFTLTNEREDLRNTPLITIDGADARDFDDAVWAERTERGYHIIVAIADVSAYVTPDSALDKEAEKRGNSVYFPDRVVPMLPERLSNNLCSLIPHTDRPVLAVHLYMDDQGRLRNHKFVRAVMHSHARLTYEQAEAALQGQQDEQSAPVLASTLQPLAAAVKILLKARQNRHALDLDIPESRLLLDDTGKVTGVANRKRLFVHQLIEECMVLANVAAAKTLATTSTPGLYRIHPEPGPEKLDVLKNILRQHALKFSGGQTPQAHDFARLTRMVNAHPAKDVLMRMILQTQQQAKYDAENIGHFGLALSHYSHFTSPIRRYADLIVHRALIAKLNLGAGGHQHSVKPLAKVAEHINLTERRAQQAEWEARDRMISRFYQQHVGKTYDATIISVQKFGCFVRVEDVAEGLLPVRLMQDDYYQYNEKRQSLEGQRTGHKLRPGDTIPVVLIGADEVEGKLTFGPAAGKKSTGL